MKKILVYLILLLVFGYSISCKNNNSEIETISEYTIKIKKSSNDRWLYHIRGKSYYKLKRYDEAIIDFTQSIKIKPHDLFYADLAKAYLAKGIISRAYEAIDNAIELRVDTNNICMRAFCLDLLGNYEKAILDYYFYLERISNNPNVNIAFIASIRASYLLYIRKDYDNALFLINKGIQIGEKNIKNINEDIYYFRFLIYLKMNQYTKAYDDLVKVLNSNFNNKNRILCDINQETESVKKDIKEIINKHMIVERKINDISYFNQNYLIKIFLVIE